METFEKEMCAQGYHIYKAIWEAAVGEEQSVGRSRGRLSLYGLTTRGIPYPDKKHKDELFGG